MSSLATFITNFSVILRRTLPTPIGRNHRFLSRVMNLLAKNALRGFSYLVALTGSFSVRIFLMTLANASLKSALVVR